jgi:hypothetical protein
MRAVVIYESMYGNTHQIAEAIAQGLARFGTAAAMSTVAATIGEVADADMAVVGGPTHAWSMSRASTRRAAAEGAGKAGSDLQLEPDASGPGVREWLAQHGDSLVLGAAFDTRIKMPSMITGSAARAIARQLRRHGVAQLARAQSFFVTKQNQTLPGETERAQRWGEELASRFAQHSNAVESG